MRQRPPTHVSIVRLTPDRPYAWRAVSPDVAGMLDLTSLPATLFSTAFRA
jgi:hypothetical protein